MNQAIDEVNKLTQDEHFNAVSFFNMGRRLKKNGKEQHKLTDWRESSRDRMLHLRDERRHNMLDRLETAFAHDLVSCEELELVPEEDHRGRIQPDGTVIVDTPFELP